MGIIGFSVAPLPATAKEVVKPKTVEREIKAEPVVELSEDMKFAISGSKIHLGGIETESESL